MTVVLALDLSTHTGAAYDAHGGRRPLCSTWHAPLAAPKDFGTRWIAFMRWLDETVIIVEPDILAFEAPLVPHGDRASDMKSGVDITRFLMGMATIAETVAAMHAIETVEENVATVKKYFTGSGRAKKPDMMARARSLNWACANHNEADAAALWAYVKAMADPKWSFSVTPIGHYAGGQR